MAKRETKVTDNPKLLQKKLSDGNFSLYLDYYLGRINVKDEATGEIKSKVQRKREFLKLSLFANPRTPNEKEQNRVTLELARRIRNEKEQELLEGKTGYRLTVRRLNFFDFVQSYYNEYTKGDKRVIKGAVKRFTDFIALEYPQHNHNITTDQITADMMEHFVEYLQSTSRGEGAATIWARWKKIIKAAVKRDLFLKNPCEGITCRTDEGALKKDILSTEEMKRLINTRYPGQNQETRRAFIFTLYTGIRFCDIKDLVYSNVDYENKTLMFNQKKTQGHSSKSWVTIPLNKNLLRLIGEGERNAKIFNLPSQAMCLKALRHWTARAGITKHITWHGGRHSFAVNILNAGANIKTVASLLGHSGLQHTEKYTRAVDKLKEDAINSLPNLEI